MRPRELPALAALCWAAAPGSLTGQANAVADVLVQSHVVETGPVELAAEARERLSIWAPDGVHLSVRDATLPEDGLERLGSWRVVREPGSSGGVVWRFEVPFVAWSAGGHTTPGLDVAAWSEGAGAHYLRVGGVAFAVTSPIPGDVRVLSPAPAEGPLDPGPAWPGLLAVLPVTLAVGSGLAWWRSGHRPAGRTMEARPVERPGPDLPTILEDPPECPAEFAVAASLAARAHQALVARGVRDVHTTREVLARAGAMLEGLEGLLVIADEVKYAGSLPSAEHVEAAARRAAEALERA